MLLLMPTISEECWNTRERDRWIPYKALKDLVAAVGLEPTTYGL